MNKTLLTTIAAVVSLSSMTLAHADPSVTASNGQRGVINFSGAITDATCDTGIIVDGNTVNFVELPVITVADFGTGASESTETPVEFQIAPLDPTTCDAKTAALSLTGKAVSGFDDVLISNEITTTNVGIQVKFADDSSLLNKGYTDAAGNFDATTKGVKLHANYFKTTEAANPGLVTSVANYQIAYL
ncbi:fimbrial protein [Photobacterium damselae]|uniref:fimbrial protein n=1 Tax=Photobacterium damselae TaxID=38293 RepID=UPI00165D5F64|nr:fimbrial protein [Photobacterium damselae]